MDIAENVVVVMQVAVEDENHGELREDKTQLMRKGEREQRDSCSFVPAAVQREQKMAEDSH